MFVGLLQTLIYTFLLDFFMPVGIVELTGFPKEDRSMGGLDEDGIS
jgi:hypothetical protein